MTLTSTRLRLLERHVRYACLFLFLLLLSSSLRAASTLLHNDHDQAIRVHGVVKNTQGDLMPGVNVLVKGTTIGTSSDANGEFSLEVSSEDDVLVFSFIGYKVFEVRVGAQTEIGVSLAEDATALEAVEIRSTGYWSDTKARSVGNIAKVSSEDIERQPVTSPLMSLQGRMAGVDVMPMTGVPGSAVTIQIRGQNSLRSDGNYPLYVIDGIPVDPRPLQPAATGLLGGSGGFDPLSTINPANIESIQVLKDADATSIYGSRGANGVILITTRRAARGGKTSFEINAYRGVGRVSRHLDMLNTQQYLEMRREAFQNNGAQPMPWNFDVTRWDTTRYTDWQKELIGGTAGITDLQAGFSGGNANTSFRLGGGFHKETLVFPGDFGYQRITGSFTMNHLSTNQKLRAVLSMNYGMDKNKLFDDMSIVTNALTLPPNAPRLYDYKGNLNWENSTFNSNPLARIQNIHMANAENLVVNGDFIYNIVRGLDVKVNTGYTTIHGTESVVLPLSVYNPAIAAYFTGSYFSGVNTRKSWIVEPQASYIKKVGESEFNVVVGGTWQEARSVSNLIENSGYTSDALLGNTELAPITRVSRDIDSQYKYVALYARVGYNWKEKYLLNLTGRRDGSSRYAPENRFANFGSVGAAWIFSAEPFMQGIKSFLSFGKLRSSFGSTGSDQIEDYRYFDTYQPALGRYQGSPSLSPSALYNPGFRWEVTRKFEVALETKMFDNRVALDVAYYRNRSSNQLIDVTLPYSTGFPSIFANFNPTVENKGWEFTLETVNIRTASLRWTTNMNFTRPENELVAFSGLENSPYALQYVVGKPLSLSRLHTFTGLNIETGIYQFLDVDGDGSSNGELDRNYFHNFGRKFYGGLTNTITLGEFELAFLLQYVNQSSRDYIPGLPGSQVNQPVRALNRWQKPGDQAEFQAYSQQFYGDLQEAYAQYTNSNAIIANSSFLRLKTLSLTYILPGEMLTRGKIESARVYVQGQNLFTVTDYRGLDPETGSSLPPLRMFTVGIQVKI